MFANTLAPPTQRTLGALAASRAIDGLYLAGGTATALQLGHRISMDLDFFAERVDPDELRGRLRAEHIMIEQERTTPGSLQGLVQGVRVSFISYPYPLLEPCVQFEGVALASLVDIGLMKMTAIASRGARRDFVDLFFILRDLGRGHLFDLFNRKFPTKRMDLYHYVRSLTYFDDAEKEPEPQMLAAYDWPEIKAFFHSSVKSMPLS